MTPKQYLSRARGIDRRIGVMLEERAQLWALATKMSSPLTGMPHGGSGADPLAHSVERIILLEHDIDDMIGSFVDIRDEITAAIAQVEDGRYRLLLHCRYILGLSWEDIGNRMHYDPRWVQQLHGYALLAVQHILDERAKDSMENHTLSVL